MTIKPYITPASIAHQILFSMLLLGTLVILGMLASTWVANSLQGNAHIINSMGSLRMQSYRLLALHNTTNLTDETYELERILNNPNLNKIVDDLHVDALLTDIRHYWQFTLKPQLLNRDNLSTNDISDITTSVEAFVDKLNQFVSVVDVQTEQRLRLISQIQNAFIILTVLLLIMSFFRIRQKLIRPWQKLVSIANAIGQGDFTQQFEPIRQDEMGILGKTINHMSHELSQLYGELEQRVNDKTAALQQKNDLLSFLYSASRQCHQKTPINERILPILRQLEQVTPLYNVQFHLYENNNMQSFNTHEICQTPAKTQISHHSSTCRSWPLKDKHYQYGLIKAQHVSDTPLTSEYEQLIATLAEQLTSTLALERQDYQKQQLLLMEERSAIARELHDSIAQSLSYLKIKVSCLQMLKTPSSEQISHTLVEMRDELNRTYSQLRELLTTFRLKLDEPSFYAALLGTIKEFNDKLGLQIQLDYALSPQSINSHQAIHLIQIIREALSNVYKHAQASQVNIKIYHDNQDVCLTILDNGIGLPEHAEKTNHYGVIIMQDRALSLSGDITIQQGPEGGTCVSLHFQPQP